MAAPTYQSTTVTDFGADATSHLANMPAAANLGDCLIAIASFDTACTITTPAGWSVIAANSGTLTVTTVFAKVAAGTEGGTTVDFVTSAVQRGSVHVIRATTWFGSLQGIIACIGNTPTSTPQINLSVGTTAQTVLWIVAQAKSAITAWGAGPPTNYANNNKTGVGEDTTASASVASATRTATASSETVTTPWTASSGFDFILIAVLPAGGIAATGVGGATPAYQSSTVTDFGADATSHVVNMPATVTKTDLLLAIASFDMSATITTPSGWTLLCPSSNADSITGVFGKVAIGNEGGTTVDFVTSATQRGSAHVLRYTVWAGTLDGIYAAVCDMGAGSPQITVGGGVTAYNAEWVIAQVKSTSTAWGAGPPTNYSNNTKTGVGEDSALSSSIASATRDNAVNNENVTTFWNTITNTQMIMVEIFPAGAFPSGGQGTGGKGKGGGKGGGPNSPPPGKLKTFGGHRWPLGNHRLW